MLLRGLFWLFLVAAFTACASPAAPMLTATSSVLVAVTSTSSPTHTPTPTSTFTPIPTDTRRPTHTPSITDIPEPTLTLTPTLAPLTVKLPHALYFLGTGDVENDYGTKPDQIWRLDPDGVTLTQFTHEVFDVKEFDVSLATGRLAYVTDQRASNQLVVIRSDGSERQVIVDNGPDDGSGLNAVSSPRWSPDGQMLALHHGGVNLYQVENGHVVKVVADYVEGPGPADNKSYFPELWSLDGKYLLVIEEGWEGGRWMLYSVEENTLASLNSPYGYNGSATWSSDSRLAVFTSSESMGDSCVSLLQFDVFAQIGSAVIPCQFSEEGYSNTGWPLLTPSGDLLYFYNYADSNEAYYSGHPPPWMMMRVKLSGAIDPVLVRSDLPAEVAEVLWDSDGTLAIVSLGQFNSGPLALVLTNGSQPLQFLAPGGKNLRWGP
jgi:dipeptidyl aminopeptidase/acylaminoacyl peptidase